MLGDQMNMRLHRLFDESEERTDRDDWAQVGQPARQTLLSVPATATPRTPEQSA